MPPPEFETTPGMMSRCQGASRACSECAEAGRTLIRSWSRDTVGRHAHCHSCTHLDKQAALEAEQASGALGSMIDIGTSSANVSDMLVLAFSVGVAVCFGSVPFWERQPVLGAAACFGSGSLFWERQPCLRSGSLFWQRQPVLAAAVCFGSGSHVLGAAACFRSGSLFWQRQPVLGAAVCFVSL